MVLIQRKNYNHFNEDVESVASAGQKGGINFGKEGHLSTSNVNNVSTLHTKGSLIRVVKVIFSFTCARFLMIIALFNLSTANMRAFADATGGIYELKDQQRQMRNMYFQYDEVNSTAMKKLDNLQRKYDEQSAAEEKWNIHLQRIYDEQSAAEEKLNVYREQIIENLQTYIQNFSTI